MDPERKIIQVDAVNPHSTKKKKTKNVLVFSILVLIIAGVFIGFRLTGKQEVFSIKSYDKATVTLGTLVTTTEASGTVVLPIQVDIVSPQEGYADKLFVSEGDSITPTDILAELEVPDLEEEEDSLTIKLEEARLELENLVIDYEYTIRSLQRSISRLEDDIAEAEEDVKVLKELAELKSSRESDYEDALDSLEALKEEYEDTIESLEETEKKQVVSLKKQDVTIHQLEVELASIKNDIEEARIKSPIVGEVLSINEDLEIPGSLITETDTLFVVADRNHAYIDFDVYEQYTDQLEIGGTMTVTIGTSTMEAEIIKIGKIATMDTDGLSATVSVRALPITEQTLTPGASAVASIILGIENNVPLLPRGAYLTTGNQKYVYKIMGNRAYKTEVTFGEIQGTDVEVLKGLEVGDRIIISGYQNFIDQEIIELK